MGIPTCECHDFLYHQKPCKHLFAILQYTTVTWDHLPHTYTKSPFFTLDMEALDLFRSVEPNSVDSNLVSASTETLRDDLTFVHLDNSENAKSDLKKLACICREKLHVIKNETYLCQNENTLEEVSKLLDNVQHQLHQNLYIEAGLVHDSTPTASRLSKCRKVTRKAKQKRQCFVRKGKMVKDLKRHPQRFIRRVGSKVDKSKDTQNEIQMQLQEQVN